MFILHPHLARFLRAISGILLFSCSINWFVTPLHLYNGGILGLSQLLRTILESHLPIWISRFDISGIIYYLFNLPLLYIAGKYLGRRFFIGTVVCVSLTTLCLTLLPIIDHPFLGEDVLGSCLIGGILSGCGLGLALSAGASLGGTDILGLYLVKKYGHTSIGRVNLIFNIIIYIVCLILFDISIALYSLIYTSIVSFTLDKVHLQNINVDVLIISANHAEKIEDILLHQLHRGVTKWQVEGSYTHHIETVFLSVMSKYELFHMRQLIKQCDPHAFIIVHEGTRIYGHFTKKLS